MANETCQTCRYFHGIPPLERTGQCRWLESLPKGIGYQLLSVIDPLGNFPMTYASDTCDHHRKADSP
jgi:hypothetical protein